MVGALRRDDPFTVGGAIALVTIPAATRPRPHPEKPAPSHGQPLTTLRAPAHKWGQTPVWWARACVVARSVSVKLSAGLGAGLM